MGVSTGHGAAMRGQGRGSRSSRTTAPVGRLLVGLGLVVAVATPARAEPPGVQTVAEWRQFLATIEKAYDARAAHAVASFYAAGAAAQGYRLTDCERPQTVGGLSAWLRTTAPPELTLLEALELNAEEHGCEPRGAEPALEARYRD